MARRRSSVKAGKGTTKSSPKDSIKASSPQEGVVNTVEKGFHLDDKKYDNYQDYVSAKRRRNQEWLATKGLLEASAQLKSAMKSSTHREASTKRHRAPDAPSLPERKSKRLAGIQAKHVQIEDDEDDQDGIPIQTKELPLPKTRIIRPRPLSSETPSLSDRDKLKDIVDWEDDMKQFLLKVPHGAGRKPVSQDNARTVMMRVQNLVMGYGIGYHRWPEGVKFLDKVCIHLGMDFSAMRDEAKIFEDEYGRDTGNGWLLTHPIKKLELYQLYRLEQLEK